MKSPLSPRSLGFGGGVRPGLPFEPSGGPADLAGEAPGEPGPGAPAERGGLLAGEARGAAPLRGAGLGSRRGGRAPQRALFRAPAAPPLPPGPPPGLRAGPCVRPAPRPPPDARAALRRRGRRGAGAGVLAPQAAQSGGGAGRLWGPSAGEAAQWGARPGWAAKAQVLGSEGGGCPARGPGPSPGQASQERVEACGRKGPCPAGPQRRQQPRFPPVTPWACGPPRCAPWRRHVPKPGPRPACGPAALSLPRPAGPVPSSGRPGSLAPQPSGALTPRTLPP